MPATPTPLEKTLKYLSAPFFEEVRALSGAHAPLRRESALACVGGRSHAGDRDQRRRDDGSRGECFQFFPRSRPQRQRDGGVCREIGVERRFRRLQNERLGARFRGDHRRYGWADRGELHDLFLYADQRERARGFCGNEWPVHHDAEPAEPEKNRRLYRNGGGSENVDDDRGHRPDRPEFDRRNHGIYRQPGDERQWSCRV